jgi:phage recombination protein Bet
MFRDWRTRTVPLEQREIQPAAVTADGQGQTQATDEADLLDLVVGKTKYSREDRDLLKRTFCKDATEDEFAMFMKYAERTGLDPFARQIYLIKRKNKVCIQTGIDGYRLIADRTKRYAGNDEPVFEGEEKLPNGHMHPLKATARVWKIVDGKREAFTASVRWEEYFPEEDKEAWMWKKMPYGQLAKCAEALAFRKAFPADLAGIYTAEDLEAPENDRPADKPKPLATMAQRQTLDRLRVRLGMDVAEIAGLIAEQGFKSSVEMTAEAADELLAQLEGTLADRQRQPGEDDQ